MAAVVNTVALLVPQVVAAPPSFLGAIYQLYNVPAVRALVMYDVVVTLSVGTEGGVAPVQIYTSYDVASATVPQVSVAVVCSGRVELLAGVLLIAQPGADVAEEAVVNTVALAAPQVVAAPPVFLGAIYQLYNVPGLRVLVV
jgi:hypothetical protein